MSDNEELKKLMSEAVKAVEEKQSPPIVEARKLPEPEPPTKQSFLSTVSYLLRSSKEPQKPETPEEEECKYCAMMIPKKAKICPHCRKSKGISAKAGWAIIIIATITIISSMMSGTDRKDQDRAFFFKCLDTYPEDANICVSGQLKGHSFGTVQAWLKEYVDEHP